MNSVKTTKLNQKMVDPVWYLIARKDKSLCTMVSVTIVETIRKSHKIKSHVKIPNANKDKS